MITPPRPASIDTLITNIQLIEVGKWEYTFQYASEEIKVLFDEDLGLIGRTVNLTYNGEQYVIQY